jgi:hypothetical protein
VSVRSCGTASAAICESRAEAAVEIRLELTVDGGNSHMSHNPVRPHHSAAGGSRPLP